MLLAGGKLGMAPYRSRTRTVEFWFLVVLVISQDSSGTRWHGTRVTALLNDILPSLGVFLHIWNLQFTQRSKAKSKIIIFCN
jgi:hypothetical protein